MGGPGSGRRKGNGMNSKAKEKYKEIRKKESSNKMFRSSRQSNRANARLAKTGKL